MARWQRDRRGPRGRAWDEGAPPLHRVDLRLAKDIPLPAGFRLGIIAEGCNILNHENYGAYQRVLNQTQFGAPRQALLNAYQPRVAQLAFKVSF